MKWIEMTNLTSEASSDLPQLKLQYRAYFWNLAFPWVRTLIMSPKVLLDSCIWFFVVISFFYSSFSLFTAFSARFSFQNEGAERVLNALSKRGGSACIVSKLSRVKKFTLLNAPLLLNVCNSKLCNLESKLGI